ncbi:unnamed protein product [Sphenostylis stenocarpa]|uniref:Uncharacterized protein n=1 Tax=Sphenostylis stenocarpa TaxID=92480 RepID=A0AA86T397_9FABA|nr:unnamed protein product [Sphenostylis stenocarpa]
MASEDSRPVKKEEESNNKSSVSKKVATSNSKVAKVKKEEAEFVKKEPKSVPVKKELKVKKEIDDELPLARRTSNSKKDPLRIFYESLYAQVPHSEMSQIWLMESGLLPKEVARRVFEKKQKKFPHKLSSPVKAVAGGKSGTKSVSVTVKKKSPTSSVSPLKKKTTNSTSKQSNKRKSKALSSEEDEDTDSDDEVILSVAKRRKLA